MRFGTADQVAEELIFQTRAVGEHDRGIGDQAHIPRGRLKQVRIGAQRHDYGE